MNSDNNNTSANMQFDAIKECLHKTRIHYSNNDGFFRPHMRGINHLEVGYSKIIDSPITIIAEALYSIYERLRDWLKELVQSLFPRNPKIYANRLDSYLTGRVVHLGRYGVNDPIHNLKIEFWARRRFTFQFRKLGESHTDAEGNFHLPFTLRMARRFINRSLRVDIMLPYEVYYRDEKPHTKYKIYYTEFISKKNLIGLGFNLNTIPLPLWEYRVNTNLPRTFFPADDRYAPEKYNQKREDALIQQIIPIELTKQKHLLQIETEPGVLTIHQIQKDYPENLTVCIEKKIPGYTRTDEWFVERLINGMNKATLQPDEKNKEIFHVKFWGICHYDHNQEYALPDVDIELKNRGNDLPELSRITFTGALNALNTDPWQVHSFVPADGETWLAAKRLARVCGAVAAEVDEHFAGTHVNTEQYAIAAFRNFRKSPIAWLLFPHLKEVSLINAAADKTIIGGYLPTATALTEKGLLQRVYDALGTQNWKGWKPMEPINDKHRYAKAENLFWKLTGDFIDHFFNTYKDQIIKEWSEVYYFSRDLVSHSVAVFGSQNQSLSDKELNRQNERMNYARKVYSFDPAYSTENIDGELKTISPITEDIVFQKETDLQNLKDACRYAIMMATFSHTWINEHQYDDLGEILYSCGGLRFGENETGVMAPESDLHIAPDLTRATTMLWFTNLLSRTEYGFITRNEEQDIHPYFIKLLLDHKDEFSGLGVDIESVESRTNI